MNTHKPNRPVVVIGAGAPMGVIRDLGRLAEQGELVLLDIDQGEIRKSQPATIEIAARYLEPVPAVPDSQLRYDPHRLEYTSKAKILPYYQGRRRF